MARPTAPRLLYPFRRFAWLELVAKIDGNNEDAVFLVLTLQNRRIIDPRIAEVDVFEGAADGHTVAPLVLGTDGVADLPVDGQIGCPVAVRDRRGVIGNAGLEQPVLRRPLMDAGTEVIGVFPARGHCGRARRCRDQQLVEFAPIFPTDAAGSAH